MATLKPIKKQGRLSAEKAWLLGMAVGDGCVFIGRKRTGAGAFTVACGLDRHLARMVSQSVSKVYGVSCRVTVNRHNKIYSDGAIRQDVFLAVCSLKLVVQDLLRVGTFGTYTWRVPSSVFKGSREVKASFIRGFADADGCVVSSVRSGSSKKKIFVSLDSVNRPGLDEVGELLSDLGIGFTGPYTRKAKRVRESHYHSIRIERKGELCKFAKLVGFKAKAKARKLALVLTPFRGDPE